MGSRTFDYFPPTDNGPPLGGRPSGQGNTGGTPGTPSGGAYGSGVTQVGNPGAAGGNFGQGGSTSGGGVTKSDSGGYRPQQTTGSDTGSGRRLEVLTREDATPIQQWNERTNFVGSAPVCTHSRSKCNDTKPTIRWHHTWSLWAPPPGKHYTIDIVVTYTRILGAITEYYDDKIHKVSDVIVQVNDAIAKTSKFKSTAKLVEFRENLGLLKDILESQVLIYEGLRSQWAYNTVLGNDMILGELPIP